MVRSKRFGRRKTSALWRWYAQRRWFIVRVYNLRSMYTMQNLCRSCLSKQVTNSTTSCIRSSGVAVAEGGGSSHQNRQDGRYNPRTPRRTSRAHPPRSVSQRTASLPPGTACTAHRRRASTCRPSRGTRTWMPSASRRASHRVHPSCLFTMHRSTLVGAQNMAC
jgi:hypothetical protein